MLQFGLHLGHLFGPVKSRGGYPQPGSARPARCYNGARLRPGGNSLPQILSDASRAEPFAVSVLIFGKSAVQRSV